MCLTLLTRSLPLELLRVQAQQRWSLQGKSQQLCLGSPMVSKLKTWSSVWSQFLGTRTVLNASLSIFLAVISPLFPDKVTSEQSPTPNSYSSSLPCPNPNKQTPTEVSYVDQI